MNPYYNQNDTREEIDAVLEKIKKYFAMSAEKMCYLLLRKNKWKV